MKDQAAITPALNIPAGDVIPCNFPDDGRAAPLRLAFLEETATQLVLESKAFTESGAPKCLDTVTP